MLVVNSKIRRLSPDYDNSGEIRLCNEGKCSFRSELSLSSDRDRVCQAFQTSGLPWQVVLESLRNDKLEPPLEPIDVILVGDKDPIAQLNADVLLVRLAKGDRAVLELSSEFVPPLLRSRSLRQSS